MATKRKFRVICLNVSGHSNKIFYHNQEVFEDAFVSGHADKLVASKHIEEIFDQEETNKLPGETTNPPDNPVSERKQKLIDAVAAAEKALEKAKKGKSTAKITAAEKALKDAKSELELCQD